MPLVYPGDAAWLRVSPTNGVTPAAVQISADPGNLAPGTYFGAVLLWGQTLPEQGPDIRFVQFTVTPPLPRNIQLDPPAITLSLTQQFPSAVARIAVRNTGGGGDLRSRWLLRQRPGSMLPLPMRWFTPGFPGSDRNQRGCFETESRGPTSFCCRFVQRRPEHSPSRHDRLDLIPASAGSLPHSGCVPRGGGRRNRIAGAVALRAEPRWRHAETVAHAVRCLRRTRTAVAFASGHS